MNWGNSLEIELGGALRTLKFTMIQSAALSEMFMQNPTWIDNPDRKDLATIMICLKHKGNDLPQGFDEEDLADWIAELSDEDRERLIDYSNEAMGFLIRQLTSRMNQLAEKTEAITRELQALEMS